jgi:putative transposase
VDGLDRAAVVRRLAALEGEGRLGAEQVRLAGGMQVSERTVWRWVRQARTGEGLDRRPRERFQVTDEIRQRVAFWRGNVAAVHRELAAAAKAGGAPAPGLSTLQRAVARAVLAGDRAGLAGGERARRAHDVLLQRPGPHRNAAWEADHVEVPVEVGAGAGW